MEWKSLTLIEELEIKVDRFIESTSGLLFVPGSTFIALSRLGIGSEYINNHGESYTMNYKHIMGSLCLESTKLYFYSAALALLMKNLF